MNRQQRIDYLAKLVNHNAHFKKHYEDIEFLKGEQRNQASYPCLATNEPDITLSEGGGSYNASRPTELFILTQAKSDKKTDITTAWMEALNLLIDFLGYIHTYPPLDEKGCPNFLKIRDNRLEAVDGFTSDGLVGYRMAINDNEYLDTTIKKERWLTLPVVE